MEEINLKELWQATNQKLEKSLSINKKQTEDISQLKVQNFLSSMKPIKLFTILIGLIWTSIVGTVVVNLFLFAYHQVNLFFLFSAAIQVTLTAFGLIVYLYQIITIYQVDLTQSILKTQEQLAQLRTSTLWVTRILLLQLPVWTTFYWNQRMFENGHWTLWFIQGLVTLLFTYAAIWLFINIRLENKDKKWFGLIFHGKEWTPLMQSIELLEQIEEYKDEK